MPLPVAIVPHTHWDREWYAPFQTYRLALVRLLDELLPLVERDPGYRHFMLDGQTAVVDDYLEVRPEAEARIRRLVASGRLSIGPWMVLMDEFMVSGETIVRNLQAGLRRAAELGGGMEVGYLPDMFGHAAQMPQLLRLAGLEHAVVWRGVPRSIRSTGFFWEAPDGSRVRAEYLYGSYSNGRELPRDPEQLVERARSYRAELGDARVDGLLLMNGTDHQMPQPWLGETAGVANGAQDDYEFRIGPLAEHLDRQPTDGLPTWRGELRSGARANVLMGVASNRVDVHQACARAERSLERRAEPLAALALPPEEHPKRLLDLAWRSLILNSAHDSSCACSHDEVVEQVLVRYREARQIADGIARDTAKLLASRVGAPEGSTVVVNPAPRARGGLVEVPVAGEGDLHFVGPNGPVPAQVVGAEPEERFATHVVGSKIGWVLDMLRGDEFAGAPVHDFTVEPRGTGGPGTGDPAPGPGGGWRRRGRRPSWDVVVRHASSGDERTPVDPLRRQLEELAAGSTDGDEPDFHIRALRPRTRRAALAVDPVGGFGWATYEPRPGPLAERPVTGEGHRIRNEHVEVEVDPGDGTFSLAGRGSDLRVAGLNRYVNGGDGGDTYNWSPPDVDGIVDQPDRVEVELVESGPVRGRLVVTSRYRWPARAEGDERRCTRRSEQLLDVEIRTTVELRAGEPLARVRCELDNPCRDQRLRAHFPLPAAVDGSDAECAFTVVRRGLEAEGGPNEAPLPTFPSRRFVDCSDGEVGLALVHDGLLEYEVLDGREVALTLLRSVGYLSRIEPSLRPEPAGPQVPVEGAQMLGPQAMEYAVVLHHGRWEDVGLHAVADAVLVPLEAAPTGSADAPRPRTGALLRVDGAEVSACTREPGGLVLRLFNPRGEPAPVRVLDSGGARARGWLVDLRDRPLEPFEGELELSPQQVVTAVLTDPPDGPPSAEE